MEPGDAQVGVDLIAAAVRTAIFCLWYIAYACCAAWVVNDSHDRGYSGVAPFYLIRVFGPFSVIVWMLARPRTRLVERPADDHASADDTLEAASKLEMLGAWNEATALFQTAAERWPEHAGYIEECIKVLKGKQDRSHVKWRF